jgi:hypothetical protein
LGRFPASHRSASYQQPDYERPKNHIVQGMPLTLTFMKDNGTPSETYLWCFMSTPRLHRNCGAASTATNVADHPLFEGQHNETTWLGRQPAQCLSTGCLMKSGDDAVYPASSRAERLQVHRGNILVTDPSIEQSGPELFIKIICFYIIVTPEFPIFWTPRF